MVHWLSEQGIPIQIENIDGTLLYDMIESAEDVPETIKMLEHLKSLGAVTRNFPPVSEMSCKFSQGNFEMFRWLLDNG